MCGATRWENGQSVNLHVPRKNLDNITHNNEITTESLNTAAANIKVFVIDTRNIEY